MEKKYCDIHEIDLPIMGCIRCKEEQAFYSEIMAEALEEEHQYMMEIKRHNDRILKAIKAVKGEHFTDDLIGFARECEADGKFRIVKKPSGDKQKENFGLIINAWVDQYSVGDSGDSFCGTVSVKLKKGKWLEMPFAT